MQSMIDKFRAARRVSTPIIAIKTPDPAATMDGIAKSLNGSAPPIVVWDAVNGLGYRNEAGKKALRDLSALNLEDEVTDVRESINLVAALAMVAYLPPGTITFWQNFHRMADELVVIQALWNLRDKFKTNKRCAVLLVPEMTLPPELVNDVLVLDEPLPEVEELRQIVQSSYEAVGISGPDEATLNNATDALAGLAAFPAEQVTAMSMTPKGIVLADLWERKRQVIEETPGLTVRRGGETFADIGGVENIKKYLSCIINGRRKPRAVVFLDELEKMFSGIGGDTSGTSQDQLGTLLGWMQDNNATGIICIGPPGSAKSAIAKATGNEAGIPTIDFDLGAMKGSLIGQSEERIRGALKVVKAMAQDEVLFIATCNSIGILPPELRRRFTFGTFFFDLPTADERAQIWELYIRKYELEGMTPAVASKATNDEGWTGAEIKQCCEISWRLGCSLGAAASYIVPVATSARDQIETLRRQANGKFISASHAGIYEYVRPDEVEETTTGKRAIDLSD